MTSISTEGEILASIDRAKRLAGDVAPLPHGIAVGPAGYAYLRGLADAETGALVELVPMSVPVLVDPRLAGLEVELYTDAELWRRRCVEQEQYEVRLAFDQELESHGSHLDPLDG